MFQGEDNQAKNMTYVVDLLKQLNLLRKQHRFESVRFVLLVDAILNNYKV